MLPAGYEPWPVLESGPAGVVLTGDAAWLHDGHRVHLAGRGAQLDSVRAGAVLMQSVQHDGGEGIVLNADRVERRRGAGISDRWATALELPLFVWERADGGHISWTTPISAAVAELNEAGTQLVLRSNASGERIVFQASSGRIAIADENRVDWRSEGPGRLTAIAASDEADLERSRDRLSRRTLPGLGRQRAQHAEQLQRGGVAMRAAAAPALADAFDWAKVRGDALLGAWLADDLRKGCGHATALAEGLLAAGLTHLPRTLRRRLDADEVGDSSAYSMVLAAWIGEMSGEMEPEGWQAPPRHRDWPRIDRIPLVEAIATGQLDAEGIAALLSGSLRSLWGVDPDAPSRLVTIAPDIARLGASAALSRLRVGRTVLDLRLRRRGEVVSIAIRRGAGPPITVDCTLRGAEVRELLVDGQAVRGNRARFELQDAHDLQLRLLGGPPLSSAPS